MRGGHVEQPYRLCLHSISERCRARHRFTSQSSSSAWDDDSGPITGYDIVTRPIRMELDNPRTSDAGEWIGDRTIALPTQPRFQYLRPLSLLRFCYSALPQVTLTVALDALVISFWSYTKGHRFYKIVFNVCALPLTIWTSPPTSFLSFQASSRLSAARIPLISELSSFLFWSLQSSISL